MVKVKVLFASHPVPKVVVGETYEVVIRSGKEFILDGYGGYLCVKAADKAGVILKDIHHG